MFLFHLASNKEHLLQPQVIGLVSHCSIVQLFSLYTLLDQLFISTTVAAKKTVSIHWDIIYPTCISHWTHMTQDFTTLICRHSSFSRPTKHHHRAIAVQTPTRGLTFIHCFEALGTNSKVCGEPQGQYRSTADYRGGQHESRQPEKHREKASNIHL